MKVVASCQPGPGHLHPMLPVLRAFEAAGHEVLVAASLGFSAHVRRLGLRPLVAGLDWRLDRLPAAFPELNNFSKLSDRSRFLIERVFAGVCADATSTQLRRVFAHSRPDLVIHEPSEFGGPIAAEAVGVPVVTHGIGRFANAFGAAEVTARSLAPLRQRFVLPPVARQCHAYLDPCPLSLHDSPPPRWLRVTPIRPEAVPSGHTASPWAGAVNRPFVYLTMGTTITRQQVLRSALAGLSGLGGTVVVTVGDHVDVSELGPIPNSVRALNFVPDSSVLPDADLVVCHGGWGTVTGALLHGLPIVLMPVGSDQLWNAERCEAVGVGRVLSPSERNPDSIRRAAASTIAQPAYRLAAARIKAEIAAMPSAATIVDKLAFELRRFNR